MKKLLAILLSVILVIGTIIGANAVVYQFGVGGPDMTLNFYIDSSKVPTTNFTEIEMKIFSSFNTYKDHGVILNNRWIQYGTVEVESSIVGAELSTGYTENQGAVTIFKFKSDEGFVLSENQPFLSFTDIPATIYNSSDSINFMVDKLVTADGTDCADNDAVTTNLIVPEGSTVPAYSWLTVDNIGLNITNTHKFFNSINQYVDDSNGDIVLSTSTEKVVINKDNMHTYLRIFEETDERVVFTYVDFPKGTSSETIDGYYFENKFFKGASSTNSGYCVYFNGKVYTIAEAVTAEIVTLEHLADILPNSQKPAEQTETSETQATEPPTEKPTTPAKAANPMKVTVKTKVVKYAKVKKSAQTVAPITVKKAAGKVTYKKLSGSNKLALKSNGKIVVKKGTKKGTYTTKIKVNAKGNSKFKSASKTVKVKIVVK